jgi:hypothetical protein
MKYATWILDFTNPDYGTGPEASIVAQGGTANGGVASGNIVEGAEILGYFTGEPTGLETWNFTELTQEEALAFVVAIDSSAYVAENGKIQVELIEREI